MFLSTQEYLYRITHALENVIAPLVESDYGRGQLLAAVFLLDQLTDRIDYKAELVKQEIEAGCETIRKIVEALKERAGEVPDDLKSFIDEVDREDCAEDLALRGRCEEMLCSAIDAFYANRDRLVPDSARMMEGLILGHLTQIASRDLGMLKPSTGAKLLQSKSES